MLRKAIIVMLMLGAIGTGVGWIVSFSSAIIYVHNSKRVMLHGGWIEFKTFYSSPQHQPRQGWYIISCTTEGYHHPCACSIVDWFSTQIAIQGSKGGLFSAAYGYPCSLLLMGFLAYPTMTFIRGHLRRYRRRKKGLCVTCGYNLTGNVSGKCSECGTGLYKQFKMH